jgi:hypothetical protein
MNGLTVVVMAVGMAGWSLLAVAIAGGIAGPLLARNYPRQDVRDTEVSSE